MSQNFKRAVHVAAMAIALCGSGVAQAATIPLVNGSFEQGTTGPAGGYQNGLTFGQLMTTGPGVNIYSGLQGWTTTSGNRIEVRSDLSTQIDAQDGNYYISLDGGRNSAIQQSVSLGIGSYYLSFWYSPENGNATTNRVNYSLGTLVSGIANKGTNGAAVGGWTEIKTLFHVTTAGSYMLRFAAAGSANRIGGFLDNIQIAEAPVPAAGFGLVGALLALGGLKRRRKA